MEGCGGVVWSDTCLSQGSDQTPLHLTACGDQDTHFGSHAAPREAVNFGWDFHNPGLARD